MNQINPFVLLLQTLAALDRNWAKQKLDASRVNLVGLCADCTIASDSRQSDNDMFEWVDINLDDWRCDLRMFCEAGRDAMGYKSAFFRRLAIPMISAYNLARTGNLEDVKKALVEVKACRESVWKNASVSFLNIFLRHLEIQPNAKPKPPSADVAASDLSTGGLGS